MPAQDTVQPRLLDAPVVSNHVVQDDEYWQALAQRTAQADGALQFMGKQAGVGQYRTHKIPRSKLAAKQAVHVALDVSEKSACSLALDASKDILVALVVITGLQDIIGAAVVLGVAVVVLLVVQTVTRHLEKQEMR